MRSTLTFWSKVVHKMWNLNLGAWASKKCWLNAKKQKIDPLSNLEDFVASSLILILVSLFGSIQTHRGLICNVYPSDKSKFTVFGCCIILLCTYLRIKLWEILKDHIIYSSLLWTKQKRYVLHIYITLYWKRNNNYSFQDSGCVWRQACTIRGCSNNSRTSIQTGHIHFEIVCRTYFTHCGCIGLLCLLPHVAGSWRQAFGAVQSKAIYNY